MSSLYWIYSPLYWHKWVYFFREIVGQNRQTRWSETWGEYIKLLSVYSCISVNILKAEKLYISSIKVNTSQKHNESFMEIQLRICIKCITALHVSDQILQPRSAFFRGQPCLCKQTHVDMVSETYCPGQGLTAICRLWLNHFDPWICFRKFLELYGDLMVTIFSAQPLIEELGQLNFKFGAGSHLVNFSRCPPWTFDKVVKVNEKLLQNQVYVCFAWNQLIENHYHCQAPQLTCYRWLINVTMLGQWIALISGQSIGQTTEIKVRSVINY